MARGERRPPKTYISTYPSGTATTEITSVRLALICKTSDPRSVLAGRKLEGMTVSRMARTVADPKRNNTYVPMMQTRKFRLLWDFCRIPDTARSWRRCRRQYLGEMVLRTLSEGSGGQLNVKRNRQYPQTSEAGPA